MTGKFNKSLQNLEVSSEVNSINFYTPNNETLSKICFSFFVKTGLTVLEWMFDFVTGIEVGVNKKIGFATGTHCYVDNVKYIEIELLPGIIPSKYNFDAQIYKNEKQKNNAIERATKLFKKKKNRIGQTLVFNIPTKCFVREEDVEFISAQGVKYDRVDAEVGISDTSNSSFNDGKEATEIDSGLLLAGGLLLLKLL